MLKEKMSAIIYCKIVVIIYCYNPISCEPGFSFCSLCVCVCMFGGYIPKECLTKGKNENKINFISVTIIQRNLFLYLKFSPNEFAKSGNVWWFLFLYTYICVWPAQNNYSHLGKCKAQGGVSPSSQTAVMSCHAHPLSSSAPNSGCR